MARRGWLAGDRATTAFGLAAVGGAAAAALVADGYTLFIIALVLLTATVGYGLNILLGLAGLVSLGHVAFYAIGAYAAGISLLAGWSFWLAWPAAGLLAAACGVLLAVPALRARGPYLAMVTIAFAFIVENGLTEWKGLTGGANGLMGIMPPSLGSVVLADREMAWLAALLAAVALLVYVAVKRSWLGRAMVASRDAEDAAQSLGIRPVPVRGIAFALSAGLAGLAGAVFAPLLMFVSPGTFPFSQSILFLLAVVVGGAGSVLGPLLGAAIVNVLPELLSSLAEFRLLIFGTLLLVVLWLAPNGIVGALAKLRRISPGPPARRRPDFDLTSFLGASSRARLAVRGIGIAFGGVRAAADVSFAAEPGRITSLIGPNGAGKTTVLNMVCGFYRPDQGSVRLGERELAGLSVASVARSGIARTYQTTQLFNSMSVLENVALALPSGLSFDGAAEDLLALVGYAGPLEASAAGLPHVDRRLVEIARALGTRPAVLILDEPAAGLTRVEKDALASLLQAIARAGVAVVLVEHDMALVMGVSEHVVVLDAGQVIASGAPREVAGDPRVVAAYLGAVGAKGRPRTAGADRAYAPVLSARSLQAGYGAAPMLEGIDLDIGAGECVTLLGANGAGKSTLMKALSGLLRPIDGQVTLGREDITRKEAHEIASRGLALVPEGRQVFPELSARDNIRLGAWRRRDIDLDAELERAVARFPRLRERLDGRAGLLSGGEQQMLAVARGLMADPKVLLLDEPSLGLAPGMVAELFAVLADLRDDGVTLLVVDQMADLALGIADRGYLVEVGRITRSGEAAAIRSDGALEAAYLGHGSAGSEPPLSRTGTDA